MDAATESIPRTIENVSKNISSETEDAAFAAKLTITAIVAEARRGSGGAASVAEHLSMLMGGRKIAEYGSHPGKPGPNGDDQNHNLEGLAVALNALRGNVDTLGRDLSYFLQKQHNWTLKDVEDLKTALADFNKTRLPEFTGTAADNVKNLIETLLAVKGGR